MPDIVVDTVRCSDRVRSDKNSEKSRNDESNEAQKQVSSQHGRPTSSDLRVTCRSISERFAGCRYKMGPSAAHDMDVFPVHKHRSPTCSLVQSMETIEGKTTDPDIKLFRIALTTDNTEQSVKKLQINSPRVTPPPILLVEVDSLKQVRKRTFSHWAYRSSPSATQMIMAGFFNCNVGDRVICIYCNIICQQWTPNSDDPCEVHKTLSPKCPYVMAMLTTSQSSSISIINEASASVDVISSQAIVYTAACNPDYMEIPKRAASFATWPNENLPSVDDLVRAGFFFTGIKAIVTCFYCNGSLQNWGANDNPMIEHARWFPHCAYAKQLCGAEVHRQIQESKRAQQERASVNGTENRPGTVGDNTNNTRLVIPDESTLSRLVAARLDLSISQSLLDRNFKLSIIKRCWEDQLRLKLEDFASDSDLLVACTILQKQIEHIDGKKENIKVPSTAMKIIRDMKQKEAHVHKEVSGETLGTNSSKTNDVEMSDTLESKNTRTNKSPDEETKNMKTCVVQNTASSGDNISALANPCVVCRKEEKRLACLPCGHLIACASCAKSVRSCPTCYHSVEVFVRVYL